jgi:hypothetical protein
LCSAADFLVPDPCFSLARLTRLVPACPRSEENVRLLGEATKIAAEGRTKDAVDAKLFFLALAVCNDVLLEVNDDGSVELNADSPDEVALVKGGTVAGYSLIGKKYVCACAAMAAANHHRPMRSPQHRPPRIVLQG